MAASYPIIAFDGICNLCNATVDFVISRDRKQVFRYASLQSPAGKRLLERVGLPPTSLTTLLLVEGDRWTSKSTAVLRIVRTLGGPWRLAAILFIVPRPIRDAIYDWIAHRRYRWFGTRQACRVPSAEERDRFLD